MTLAKILHGISQKFVSSLSRNLRHAACGYIRTLYSGHMRISCCRVYRRTCMSSREQKSRNSGAAWLVGVGNCSWIWDCAPTAGSLGGACATATQHRQKQRDAVSTVIPWDACKSRVALQCALRSRDSSRARKLRTGRPALYLRWEAPLAERAACSRRTAHPQEENRQHSRASRVKR